MFCKYCGKPLNPGARFCEECGTPAPENVRENPAGTESALDVVERGGLIPGEAPKSRQTAGLLAIFLGAFGVHNFYLGYTTRGLIQLLVSLFSCGTGSVGMWIWALVEGVNLLNGNTKTDAKGNLLE